MTAQGTTETVTQPESKPQTIIDIAESLEQAEGLLQVGQAIEPATQSPETQPTDNQFAQQKQERLSLAKWFLSIGALLTAVLVTGNLYNSTPVSSLPSTKLLAPMTTSITSLFVKPGEQVVAGQLLLALDAKALEVHRLELNRRSDHFEEQYDIAHANGDLNQMRTLLPQIVANDADLAQTVQQLELTLVCATSDGIVDQNLDVNAILGRQVASGDVLLELTSPSKH